MAAVIHERSSAGRAAQEWVVRAATKLCWRAQINTCVTEHACGKAALGSRRIHWLTEV